MKRLEMWTTERENWIMINRVTYNIERLYAKRNKGIKKQTNLPALRNFLDAAI